MPDHQPYMRAYHSVAGVYITHHTCMSIHTCLPHPTTPACPFVTGAYHILNMVNNLRDILKGLHHGDLDLVMCQCQLSSQVEEVGG